MNDPLQGFVQQLLNYQAGTTVEQKLASMNAARDYVLFQKPPVDILCMNTILNLQVYGQLPLFEGLIQLLEGIVSVQPRVELLLPIFDFLERIEYNCEENWLVPVLSSLSLIFRHILPQILSVNGRGGPLGSSWHHCWQKMSCLGQSLGVKSLTSPCLELQAAGLKFIETVVLMYSEPVLLETAGSDRGSPSADMLISNCRYLIGQLVEQLDAGNFSVIQGTGPLLLIKSLASIGSQRLQFLNSIIPGLIHLIQEGKYKVPQALGDASRSDSYSISLAVTLKQSLLLMTKSENLTNKQRASLLEGLCLLGSKATLSHLADKQLGDPSGGSYREAKRSKVDEGLSSDQKVSVFNGKLDVKELQLVFELLMKRGQSHYVIQLCDQLNDDLVLNLLLHNFRHSPTLPIGEKPHEHKKKRLRESLMESQEKSKVQRILEGDKKAQDSTSKTALKPMEMTVSDRLILMEYSSSKLMKLDSTPETGLPLGMQLLCRLSNEDQTPNIPLDLIFQFIGANFQSKASIVHDLIVQLLFDLFVKYGSSIMEEMTTPADLQEEDLVNLHDKTLFQILDKLTSQKFSPKDKSIRDLLMDLPSLPPLIIHSFFRKMLSKDSTTASSFLITAVSLMEAKPLLKSVLLKCVLESCVSMDLEIREKAIRLVKNRLHVDSDLTEKIEEFAKWNLQCLLSEMDQSDTGKFCHLYLALCTRKASLLRTLMEVYGQADDSAKAEIQENAKQLSEAMPFLIPEIFTLINDLPAGSERLLLFLLSIFPDRIPPQRVVDACLEQYQKSKNIRFLVPILPGLPKKRVLEIIPLLTELPLEEFSPIIIELVNRPQFGEEAIEPSEILISLVTSADSPEALSTIRAALDHCIKQLVVVFDKEVLAGALNKLVHMGTLPMLFMRTVLLAINREKELGTFVLQSVLSPAVVTGKIRSEANQWKGYLLLLERLPPAAFRHLLSLPTRLMTSALRELPKIFVENFSTFVNSEECNVRVAKDALLAIEECLHDASQQETSSKMTSSSQAGGQSDHEPSTSTQKQSDHELSTSTQKQSDNELSTSAQKQSVAEPSTSSQKQSVDAESANTSEAQSGGKTN